MCISTDVHSQHKGKRGTLFSLVPPCVLLLLPAPLKQYKGTCSSFPLFRRLKVKNKGMPTN